MPTLIEQHPLFTLSQVEQELVWVVSNDTIVANNNNPKFVAEIHISAGQPINLSVSTDVIGTFKSSPNNKGKGMFNLRTIIESFVNPDNMEDALHSVAVPTYKNVIKKRFPIHVLDKFAPGKNVTRYCKIQFKTEYVDSNGQIITTDAVNSLEYIIFNGYVSYADRLETNGIDFGFNTDIYNLNTPNSLLSSNAPRTQYANLEDYGVFSYIATAPTVTRAKIQYFSGNLIMQTENINNINANGGITNFTDDAQDMMMHFGAFPANLRNYSTIFAGMIALVNPIVTRYTIQFQNSQSFQSRAYEIILNCNTLTDGGRGNNGLRAKGYEPIRLGWLNKFGAWDYYTFNFKSVVTQSLKSSTYQQLEGTYNDTQYFNDGYKGGKKTFNVNSTESIKMNTGFLTNEESLWFQELMSSPEIYIIGGFDATALASTELLNDKVTPVVLKSKKHTTKTKANDKLIQYTIEVEKVKTQRTQSI